jgi:hypothetical protein
VSFFGNNKIKIYGREEMLTFVFEEQRLNGRDLPLLKTGQKMDYTVGLMKLYSMQGIYKEVGML